MPSHDPLEMLGRWLSARNYRFVTVTPATHARVNARAVGEAARSIEDVFGWSRPFHPSLLPREALSLLDAAGALESRGDLLASRVRYSTLGADLFVHSAYPTEAADSVFFGPDTYRFASLIASTLSAPTARQPACVVDVGCGSGAGGIAARRTAGGASRLVLTDINPAAVRCAKVNAALAGVDAECLEADLFDGIDTPIDLIVANPPYLADPQARLYRNGGGEHGSALSLRIVREGLPRLAPGGRLVLYSGSCIVNGEDRLRSAFERDASAAAAKLCYRELDPDVFGEELARPGYEDVDRIAVVAAVFESMSA
jgi:SAM-dependent methyltransferase